VIPHYGSYRDPRSSISVDGDSVTRRFDAQGAEAFRSAEDKGLIPELFAQGLIPEYQIVRSDPLEVRSSLIKFVSYPDEWTPEMLRDAGLLTLKVARTLWAAGFHLRDASAYNVVFDGAEPKFVDLGSIGAGRTPSWTGYAQFCDHFLSPLLIESYLNIPFRGIWSLEGVPLKTAARMFRGLSRFRSGVFANVLLRSRLEASHADDSAEERTSTRRDLALSANTVDHLMQKMERTLTGLRFSDQSTWANYEASNSYKDGEELVRDEAVRAFALQTEHRRVALDVGANAGRHSRLLGEVFPSVVSLDLDEVAVEIHRQRLMGEPSDSKIFPIVADLARPTPATGFMNAERSDLLNRLKGVDAVTWMAVIHHLVITESIPLANLAEMAAQLADRHLIEFVAPDDPMVILLSSSKDGEHHLYSSAAFEEAFGVHFRLEALGPTSKERHLYLAQK
jgi:hypothetical protein